MIVNTLHLLTLHLLFTLTSISWIVFVRYWAGISYHPMNESYIKTVSSVIVHKVNDLMRGNDKCQEQLLLWIKLTSATSCYRKTKIWRKHETNVLPKLPTARTPPVKKPTTTNSIFRFCADFWFVVVLKWYRRYIFSAEICGITRNLT